MIHQWWDDASLTPVEDRVIELKGENQPVPLRALGEGVNRMFGLSLAIEAARASNMLLVDEIENGIHYSVLPDLWKFMFATARDAGIQVFATTHSWDCIEAFQQAAQAAPNTGVLIGIELR